MDEQTTQEPASSVREMPGGPPIYISPVLQKLHEDSRPKPSPACATCPASLWFISNEQLQCFCTRMHLIVWNGVEKPVMKCDGRELAIVELLARAEDR